MSSLNIYQKRKPILQIRVLYLLCKHGKLSVSLAEKLLKILGHGHHHAEIHQSFGTLRTKNLIVESIRGDNLPLVVKRGRREKFYCLSEAGMKAILTENPDPILFWSALIGLSQFNRKCFTVENVDSFYKFFLAQFVKFPDINIVPILEHLGEAIDDWLNENFNSKECHIENILNVLATHPNLTIEQIQSKTSIKLKEIKRTIDSYCLQSLDYTDAYFENEGDYFDTFIPCQFKDYILHNLISFTTDRKKIPRFSLSLFGIILHLLLIRRRSRESQLYTYEMSFDKVSQNYTGKLPLIFGKLDFLKSNLQSLAVYNFDLILLSEKRRSEVAYSFLSGVNKEILQNIYSLSSNGTHMLNEVYTSGLSAYIEGATEERVTLKSIPLIASKHRDLKELLMLRSPVRTLPAMYESMTNERSTARTQIPRTALPDFSNRQSEILNNIETLLGIEISLLYFLNLNSENFYPVGFGVPTKPVADEELEEVQDQNPQLTFKEVHDIISPPMKVRLSKILDADFDIRNWLCRLVASAASYQQAMVTSMEQAPFATCSQKKSTLS